MSDKKKFLVVGTARNCSSTIQNDLAIIRSSLTPLGEVSWLIVESDSSDETINTLSSLQKELTDFDFISLGELAPQMSKRTDRLACCRNYYANEIKNNPKYDHITHVIVADLDNVVRGLTTEGVSSCFEAKYHWAVCCANQKRIYYDIWALRHPTWSPNDCWAQYYFLRKYLSERDAHYSSIWSRMFHIDESEDWIEVDSAFGGFAIYLKEAFIQGTYIGLDNDGNEICEHVPFHETIRRNGGRIFINPRLILDSKTFHTRPNIVMRLILRILRFF